MGIKLIGSTKSEIVLFGNGEQFSQVCVFKLIAQLFIFGQFGNEGRDSLISHGGSQGQAAQS
jgi:hypothetical protein